MTTGTSLSLVALLCVAAAGGGAQDERDYGTAVWEKAIAAKGGRDRLQGIRSFAILERGGVVRQIACELPNRWWEFDDYRPLPLGYSVSVVDAETGLGWASYSGYPAREYVRPNRNIDARLRRLQYVYFVETRWVRPRPLHGSRARLRFKSVDRIETEIAGETVLFYLDPHTHLPVRIETSRTVTVTPPRPRAFGSRTSLTSVETHTFMLDHYRQVAGIQVPERVTFNRATSRVTVEINPDIDPAIFTRPPSPAAGIDGWRQDPGQG